MMTCVFSFNPCLAATSRAQAGGALCSANVPRPSGSSFRCRYATYPKRQGSEHGRAATVERQPRLQDQVGVALSAAQRSGIKEESAALGRLGGQPRS